MQQSNAETAPALAPDCRAGTPGSIDRSFLDAIRSLESEDDPGIVRELITIYLEDSTSRMADIKQTVLDGDSTRIRRAAHGLKGSSANVGATGLAALCAELEHLPPGASGSQLLQKIEVEFRSVRTELELERDR